MLRPIYTGDFYSDFSGDFKRNFGAISNRPCKLLAIPQFTIVAKSRLKSQQTSQQNRQCKRAFAEPAVPRTSGHMESPGILQVNV